MSRRLGRAMTDTRTVLQFWEEALAIHREAGHPAPGWHFCEEPVCRERQRTFEETRFEGER